MFARKILGTVVGSGLLLSGCASFEGMPEPVLDVNTVVAIPASYQMATVLERMDALDDPNEKRELRNRTAALYMAAADARYQEFRRSIAKDMKGSNFGLDLGVLGLSGIGSIAKGAANEFSAGAAALTGTRSSLNKELYFERTLPAIVAAMETNRLRQRTDILRRLREDDVIQYPLEQVFADLTNYQMAASLDGAIEQITTAAGQANAIAVSTYENALESCGPDEEVGSYWGRLNDYAYSLAEGADASLANDTDTAAFADLAVVAELMGVSPAIPATSKEAAEAQAAAITAKARDYCTKGTLSVLFDEISRKTERRIPDDE